MKGAGSHFAMVDYTSLNAKQKEVHNFHHIAAVLAKHGYASYPIRDDWNGGDMIARHMTDPGREMLTIQIKGRLTFDRKYQNKGVWIGFPHQPAGATRDGTIYVYPHDEILAHYGEVRAAKGQQPLEQTGSWQKDGQYSWDSPTKDLLEMLRPYRLIAWDTAVRQADGKMQEPGQGRLQRLAAFAYRLCSPPTDGGTAVLGDGTTGAPFRPGNSPTAGLEAQLSKMIYDAGWVMAGFDWCDWMQNDGDRYWKEPGTLAGATEDDLAKLLTAIVRQERFSDDTLREAIANGVLLAAAERARSLLKGTN
jgi:hypothetical protein